MAWTAPSTWTNGAVVTDTQLNQQLRDNMLYLKGSPTFDGSPTIGGTSSAQTLSLFGNADATANGPLLIKNTSAGTIGVAVTLDASGATSGRKYSFLSTASGASLVGAFAVYDSTAGTYRMAIDSSGKMALGGAFQPQGLLHGYNTVSGFQHWEFNGVDGTVRTIIPDGAGDVLYYVTGLFAVRTSGGNLAATTGIGIISPGTGQDLYNNGGNILRFNCNANGSVDIQRTGGSLTYKVGLWLLWL